MEDHAGNQLRPPYHGEVKGSFDCIGIVYVAQARLAAYDYNQDFMRTAIAILFLAAALAPAADLRAGRASVIITPPKGAPMAGYYYVRLNEGTHDDLHSKALVIASGGDSAGSKAALVALDLASIPRDIVEEARKLIASSTGIPGDHVMISATHTHTGPELGARLKGVDAQTLQLAMSYRASLAGKIAESVRLANADLQFARLRAGIGHESSVSFIRRYKMKDGTIGWNPGKLNPNIMHPMSSIDPDLPVLYFESTEGKPLATYVNFANHLDTVGGMQYSADYPYTIGKVLGEVKGPEMLTMFTIGTAGNINHVDVRTKDPQKGNSEAARIGAILAGDVVKTWGRMEPIGAGPLHSRTEIVNVPIPPIAAGDLEKARAIVANYGKPGANKFYDQVYAFKVLDLEERHGKRLEAEVQVITLGDQVAWVGLPGEIFVELGKSIKIASPYPYTIIAELANGALGYVPDRKAYAEGAYEVISSRFAAGGGELLVDAARRMLNEGRATVTSWFNQ